MAACAESHIPVIKYSLCGCVEPLNETGDRARTCPHGNTAVKDKHGWKVEHFSFTEKRVLVLR